MTIATIEPTTRRIHIDPPARGRYTSHPGADLIPYYVYDDEFTPYRGTGVGLYEPSTGALYVGVALCSPQDEWHKLDWIDADHKHQQGGRNRALNKAVGRVYASKPVAYVTAPDVASTARSCVDHIKAEIELVREDRVPRRYQRRAADTIADKINHDIGVTQC